ncbi:hypothetical protein ACXYMX_03755 [Sporosarcina sp. CAU 1771]
MLKKAIPLVIMSGLVLGACGMDKTVPNNNETPMENVDDRNKDWTPKVNDDRQGGPNLDGIDKSDDMNGNGVINDGTGTSPNESIIENRDGTTPDDSMKDTKNPNGPDETNMDNNLNNR